MRELFAILVVVGLGGCGASAGHCSDGVSMPVVQTSVFSGCSTSTGGGCHAAAPFGANLDLSNGNAWVSLVHAPSSSSQGKFRVEPGDLERSFLWQKLQNNLAGDGSEGVPMPRDRNDHWAPLADAQLAAVRCWISEGASN
jgi:hypothetical protein